MNLEYLLIYYSLLLCMFCSIMASSHISSLVLCGPSGVGKGTIISNLLQHYNGKLALSVSHTTRKPRPSEINGIHYFFVSKEAIQQGISNDLFLEHATVHSNIYGTSKQAVETVLLSKRVCLLDVDVTGVKQLKQVAFPAKYVFIAPPSFEELEFRLRGRATESEEQIKTRLSIAKSEIDYGEAVGNFDMIVTNNNIVETVDTMISKINEWYSQTLLS